MKQFLFFKRKPGLTHEQFRAHYETSHAPLSLKLLPGISGYRRNYVQPSPNGAGPDYDVITELTFDSRADFDRMLAAMADEDVRKQIVDDIDKFVDRSYSHPAFFIDEVITDKGDIPR